MSVNGSDFVKCSTRSISTSRRDYGQSAVLELFIRKNKQKLAAIAHPGPRGGKSRQKPSKMSEICLPPPKMVRASPKVGQKIGKIVYHGGQIKCPQLQPSQPDCTRPKCLTAAPTLAALTLSPEICTKKPQLPCCDFSKLFTFPPIRRRLGRLRHECSRPAGSPKTASILPLLQVWPNGRLAFLLQLVWPCEHLLQNRRHSSAC